MCDAFVLVLDDGEAVTVDVSPVAKRLNSFPRALKTRAMNAIDHVARECLRPICYIAPGTGLLRRQNQDGFRIQYLVRPKYVLVMELDTSHGPDDNIREALMLWRNGEWRFVRISTALSGPMAGASGRVNTLDPAAAHLTVLCGIGAANVASLPELPALSAVRRQGDFGKPAEPDEIMVSQDAGPPLLHRQQVLARHANDLPDDTVIAITAASQAAVWSGGETNQMR